jgi:hypothetical protein
MSKLVSRIPATSVATLEKPKRASGARATVASAMVRPEYSKYVEMDIEGMESIKMVKAMKQRESRSFEPPNQIVGIFGITEESGWEHNVAWRITGARKDKRHGPVEPPEPVSEYGKHLMESMFKNW